MRRGRAISVLTSLALSLGLVATACARQDPTVQPGGDQGEDAGGDGGGEDAGGGDGGDGGGDTRTIAGEQANFRGSEKVTGMAEAQVDLDDFSFSPTILRGEPDQIITLTLNNVGGAPHTFTADAGVDQELQPGDEGVTVDVAFPPSGTLPFYCRFHRMGGMLGAMTVGGDAGAGDGDAGDSGGGGGGGYNY